MSNTRNTPVEAFEQAFPLRIRTYALRQGSGGEGEYAGGEGLIREYEVLGETSATILTDRREGQPYGPAGGRAGWAGPQLDRARGRDGRGAAGEGASGAACGGSAADRDAGWRRVWRAGRLRLASLAWLRDAPAASRKALLAASLGWMLDSFDVMLYSLVLASLMVDLHLSKAAAGSLGSITLLAAARAGWCLA